MLEVLDNYCHEYASMTQNEKASDFNFFTTGGRDVARYWTWLISRVVVARGSRIRVRCSDLFDQQGNQEGQKE